MFNFVHVKIVVELLLVADMIRAMASKVRPLEIGTSGTIPCDHNENDPDVRVVQWYKSRNIDAFENGDPSLAWWTPTESGSLPNYHMDNTTFSLVIGNATLEDEGLYKCFVVHGDSVTRSDYFIRTFMYALPRKDPKITLNIYLNRINCTVEHVKPLIYPVFDFELIPGSIPQTYAVTYEDGTYTTSVSCALPRNKSVSPVECSFSYLYYQRVGLFVLPDITTNSMMENITTTVSPMGTSVTFAGDGCRTGGYNAIISAGIVIGLLIVIICIMFLVLIRKFSLKRIWIRRDVQNCNKAEESKENMLCRCK